MVSADDDMRPYSLMEHSPESLESDEICRGRLHKAGENGYGRKSFDILTAFRDVLGRRVAEVPDNYDRGELIVDTAMDLETNATNGLSRGNSLLVRRGPLPADAVVKMAQTFRSGTADIDALDLKIQALHSRARDAAEAATTPGRAEAMRLFAANLHKAFYGFEPDFFQHNLLRMVDDAVSVIKGSIELWPTLVEVCYFQKGRVGLPRIRVNNNRK